MSIGLIKEALGDQPVGGKDCCVTQMWMFFFHHAEHEIRPITDCKCRASESTSGWNHFTDKTEP